MHHIVCLSGGEGSALTALAVAARYPHGTILLNHDLNPRYEDASIKAYKRAIADYLGLPITYANINGITDPELIPSQFDVCIKAKAFKVKRNDALCTTRLKMEPYQAYLAAHHAPGTATVYYGYEDFEQERIANKRKVMGLMGYEVGFPVAEWPNVLGGTDEIGIAPPETYAIWKHANCVGCLKAGQQHWYVVFCTRPDIWKEAKAAEAIIGHSIGKYSEKGESKPLYLKDMESAFARMKCEGVPASEHYDPAAFQNHWAFYELPLMQEMGCRACGV